MMSVSEAVKSRHSIRAFLDKPVSLDLVLKIIDEAKYAPSGGNLQPWKVYILHGKTKDFLISQIDKKLQQGIVSDNVFEYNVFPPTLKKTLPHFHKKRVRVAVDMYKLLNIKRDDKKGRLQHYYDNWKFFGAPIGLIFTIHPTMEHAQYSDLGMFVQTIMLLCEQYGLSTCAQEAWATWPITVKKVLNIENDKELLFCGMAIGYKDCNAKVNQLETERDKLKDFVVIPKLEDMNQIPSKL